MKILFSQISTFLVCTFFGWIGFTSADAVTDWNLIMFEAGTTATAPPTLRPGPVTAIDFAMVHIAIHDAVQAYEKKFEPYSVEISSAAGSPIAAISKAAHDVLVNRFSEQAATLDSKYAEYLANNGLSESDAGVSVGQLAAESIIAARENDGSFPDPPPDPFLGGTDPGQWRPTPPDSIPGLIPWLADVKPFALESVEQCLSEPPPELSSDRYRKDYDEVKKIGSVNSADRTDDETDMAHFWSANILQTWSIGLRDLATENIDNLGDSARLFALNYIANADSLICGWEKKYQFVLWRPITAIQEGENDGNPRTIGDPTWTPLLTTPPYPAYISTANALSGSTTRILVRFFGTNNMSFSLTSEAPETINKTRSFTKFTEPAEEVVDARVLQGIHFRFDDQAGRRQGVGVANFVFENFLQPICNDTDGNCDNDDATDTDENSSVAR